MKRDILSQIRKNSGFASKARNTLADEYKTFPVIFEYAVTADATTRQAAFTAPFAMRISFISVRCTAANANATILPSKAATAMCTAIACAENLVVTNWSAGVVAAQIVLAAGDVVNVASVGGTTANTKGVVTFFGIRL